MAEARGFEPPRPFGPHDFESCAFNHSATLPPLILAKITLNYNRLRANKKFHHYYLIHFFDLKSLFIKTLPRQNISHKKSAPEGNWFFHNFIWYTRQDSNLRPFAPQANALSSWATGACVNTTQSNIHLEIKWASYYYDTHIITYFLFDLYP